MLACGLLGAFAPGKAFASSRPGGMWVAPANGEHVGNSTELKASAYPTYAGDPGIAYVNFTGWYNGSWHVICHVTSPSYSNVYQCPWTLQGVISPGYVTISFDVYNWAGQVNNAPNGMHSIDYVPPSVAPGGMWVAPANGAQVGDTTSLKATAYPTHSWDAAIAYVNFTAWYNNAWHVLCQVSTPTSGNTYQCAWTLKGVISPGYVTVSFDVYNRVGQVNHAPNGMHSILYTPPPAPPTGVWVAPGNGEHVGDSTVLKASAYRVKASDPAIAYVNFLGWYNGRWNTICHVTSPTSGTTYQCAWTLKGVISPGFVTVSFDVYNTANMSVGAPNGWRSIDYVPGTPSASTLAVIAWAKSQVGSQRWNGYCEVFVENAFNTQYQFASAQDAYNRLHVATTGAPPIGALVWFKPNASNGGFGHVGIYLGNNQYISATYSGVVVRDMTAWSNSIAPYEGWGYPPPNWPGR